MTIPINIPQHDIELFCRRHHVQRLGLFGSAVHGTLKPDSDLDVLVEFDPDHIPGLAFFKMQQELSDLLWRKVDLNTFKFLSPNFRDSVMSELKVLYESA